MALKLLSLADLDIPTAGTAVALSATATPITSVTVQAHPSNTGNVFVADSNVSSSRGVALSPGQSIALVADMSGRDGEELVLSDIFVDTATNGNDVKIVYMKRR